MSVLFAGLFITKFTSYLTSSLFPNQTISPGLRIPGLGNGNHFCVQGTDFWNVNTLLKAIQTHAPEVYSILNKGEDSWCTDNEQSFLDEFYPTTPSISIDYAIMEKAQNIYTIPADIGWSDLGTWGSLHQQFSKDEDNNAKHNPNP